MHSEKALPTVSTKMLNYSKLNLEVLLSGKSLLTMLESLLSSFTIVFVYFITWKSNFLNHKGALIVLPLNIYLVNILIL